MGDGHSGSGEYRHLVSAANGSASGRRRVKWRNEETKKLESREEG
jgi:hypothetical protein